jgi:hypothetical protein
MKKSSRGIPRCPSLHCRNTRIALVIRSLQQTIFAKLFEGSPDGSLFIFSKTGINLAKGSPRITTVKDCANEWLRAHPHPQRKILEYKLAVLPVKNQRRAPPVSVFLAAPRLDILA